MITFFIWWILLWQCMDQIDITQLRYLFIDNAENLYFASIANSWRCIRMHYASPSNPPGCTCNSIMCGREKNVMK
jgi:hypothetical protein